MIYKYSIMCVCVCVCVCVVCVCVCVCLCVWLDRLIIFWMCNKININIKGFIFAYFHNFLSNAAIIYICYFISYATHILLDLNKYTKRMFSLYLDETVYCLALYKKWNQVRFFQPSYVLILSSL